MTFIKHQELTCFEIPMDDGAAMEVPEADADLVGDVGDLGLGQPLLQVDQDRVQRAAVAKLQEHLQKRETFLSETPGYLFNALLFECCAMSSRSIYTLGFCCAAKSRWNAEEIIWILDSSKKYDGSVK